MLRIGLLGGTFDPPHMGHLWLAETAREQLQLDQVLFLPVGTPIHKKKRSLTAVSHRVAMVRLSIQDHPNLHLDTTDIERPPPHSTATLIPYLQATYPDAALWLLLGSDSLRDFANWVTPGQIIQQCRLGVLPRPEVSLDIKVLETAVPGLTAATDYLEGPTISLSSTHIRAWAAAGKSLRYLVDTAVWQYIRQHTLYALAIPS